MGVRHLLPTILMAMLCSGCGHEPDYRTIPVRGVLTCQGKPVAGVQVIFSPKPGEGRNQDMPGKSASGVTDENGRFVLSTYGLDDGAIVATHSVTILLISDPLHPAPKGTASQIAPCLNETRDVVVSRDMGDVILNLGE